MKAVQKLCHPMLVIPGVAALGAFFWLFALSWQHKQGDSRRHLEAIEGIINQAVSAVGKPDGQRADPKTAKVDPMIRVALSAESWLAIEQEAATLAPENERTALAKAMAGSLLDPSGGRSQIWGQHDELSKRPWKVQEPLPRFGAAVFAGALGAVAVAIAALISLLVLRWIWYFGLKRIRELSSSIRGA